MQSAAENDLEFTKEELRLVLLIDMHDTVVQALGFQWGDLPVDERYIDVVTAFSIFTQLGESNPCPPTLH